MQPSWTPKPGDRVVRRPRAWTLQPLHLKAARARLAQWRWESPYILFYGFAGIIVLGTLVLLMPFTNTQGGFTPFTDALFTATSAVTVTGLTVVDTPTYWTTAGHAVILVLILVGGLGFMTSATFLLIMIGQRITLANRLLMRDTLGVPQLGGLVRLTKRIVLAALVIQSLGTLLLLPRLLTYYPAPQAAWQALFHAVSAFNNAGFYIFPDPQGLMRFQNDLVVLMVIAALIILGGISYSVLVDVFGFRRFVHYTLDTKLVLTTSLALWVLAALVIFASEYSNAGTFGPMPFGTKALNAFFLSVSARTGGFNSVTTGLLEQQTLVLLMGLMFVGAASASTGGGIKVNTLAVILAAVVSTIRGRPYVAAFNREIPYPQVHRALVLGALGTLLVFVTAFALTMTQGGLFIRLLFESFSAFGTVGLSTGGTGSLSGWGQFIIMGMMFVGRLGPLTLGLVMARGEATAIVFRYAQERVKIG